MLQTQRLVSPHHSDTGFYGSIYIFIGEKRQFSKHKHIPPDLPGTTLPPEYISTLFYPSRRLLELLFGKTTMNHPVKSCFLFQAPCRAELQRALDRLASNTRTHDDLFTIPIPNCDRNGDFHPKQVCDFNNALSTQLIQTRSRAAPPRLFVN